MQVRGGKWNDGMLENAKHAVWLDHSLGAADKLDGEAPRIAWTLPAGWQAGEIRWPVPQRIPVGPLVNYGYEDTVTLLVPVTVPPSDTSPPRDIRIAADVSWLVCKEECIPQDGRIGLSLRVGDLDVATTHDRFAQVRATWPVELPGDASYQHPPAENHRKPSGYLPGQSLHRTR